MARIEIITEINAPPRVVFDLARDLDLHKRSMDHTEEQAIAGRTSGLIELGEEVTWRAKHFGMFHTHTSRISHFDSPRHFRDEMVRGRFKRFDHDHYFEEYPGGTRMTDVIVFSSPASPIGLLVDWIVMTNYLKKLIKRRCDTIKLAAETVKRTN